MSKETSKLYVDENVIRFVAVQVIFLTVVSVIEQWEWLTIFLTLDFGIRAFTVFPSSLSAFSKVVVEIAGLKPQPIFAPPKRFAAALGFIFSLTITVLIFIELPFYSYVVAGILIFCAFLESVFKICLGCYVYNWIVAPIQNNIQKNS